MITVIAILGILSTTAIVGTLLAVARDGYRPTPTDWMRLP